MLQCIIIGCSFAAQVESFVPISGRQIAQPRSDSAASAVPAAAVHKPTDAASFVPAYLPAEARTAGPAQTAIQQNTPVIHTLRRVNPTQPPKNPHVFQHITPTVHSLGGVSPTQPPQSPQHQAQLGLQVSSYQPQQPGTVMVFGNQKKHEKKPIPGIKDMKPAYYPKVSTYSSVPAQPRSPVSARFVADPSRTHLVEEISVAELQRINSSPYSMVQQPVQMHGHNFNYVAAVPGGGLPGGSLPPYYNAIHQVPMETATVKYEQTEHGFMDRVWGEVETMRQTITTDFFGAIPNFFRNMWDAVYEAVGPSSARMLSSVDWHEVAKLTIEQVSAWSQS